MNILQKQPNETNEDADYRLLRTKLRTGTDYPGYLKDIETCCGVDAAESMRLADIAYKRFYSGN
jgi:hypothetical protein